MTIRSAVERSTTELTKQRTAHERRVSVCYRLCMVVANTRAGSCLRRSERRLLSGPVQPCVAVGGRSLVAYVAVDCTAHSAIAAPGTAAATHSPRRITHFPARPLVCPLATVESHSFLVQSHISRSPDAPHSCSRAQQSTASPSPPLWATARCRTAVVPSVLTVARASAPRRLVDPLTVQFPLHRSHR